MNRTDLRQAILAGIVLGIVAGLIVWYLERFNEQRVADLLASDFQRRLDLEGRFRDWLEQEGRE